MTHAKHSATLGWHCFMQLLKRLIHIAGSSLALSGDFGGLRLAAREHISASPFLISNPPRPGLAKASLRPPFVYAYDKVGPTESHLAGRN